MTLIVKQSTEMMIEYSCFGLREEGAKSKFSSYIDHPS